MSYTPPRIPIVSALAGLLTLVTACTGAPSFETRASVALALEVKLQDTHGQRTDRQMPLSVGQDGMARALHTALVQRGCVSAVYLMEGSDEEKEITRRRSDIVLHAILEGKSTEAGKATTVWFEYAGPRGYWWFSTIAWIGTWIGGHLIADCRYRTNLQATCSMQDASNIIEDSLCSRWIFAPKELTTSFLERNPLLSWPLVQTLFVPPFLSSDHQESTSATLTHLYIEDLADRIAKTLSEDFEVRSWQDLQFRFQHEPPDIQHENGKTRARVQFEVRTKLLLTKEHCKWAVRLAGGNEELSGDLALDGPSGSPEQKVYRGTVEVEGLPPSEHLLQLTFVEKTATGVRACSRSVLLGEAKP